MEGSVRGLTSTTIKRERRIFYLGCASIIIGVFLLSVAAHFFHYEITAEQCKKCRTNDCQECLTLKDLDTLDDRVLSEKYYSWTCGLGILAYIILTVRFATALKLHWGLAWFLYPVCALVFFIFWLVPFVMLYLHSKWALDALASNSTLREELESDSN